MTESKEKFSFGTRLKTMIKFDFRRLFTTLLFYIIVGSCLLTPVLITVMITMMEGSPVTDQDGNPVLDEEGNPKLMEGLDNVWTMIGSSNETTSENPFEDITTMCNINLVFFGIIVLMALFIGQDFKSGYSKNIFCVRSSKIDYVISKTLVGVFGGIMMLFAFFVGTLLGGAISGISFAMDNVDAMNIIMCLLGKVGIVILFASLFSLISYIGKGKIWLSLVIGLGVSMILYMMIPSLTPLNSTYINALICLGVGLVVTIILSLISIKILNKTSLI